MTGEQGETVAEAKLAVTGDVVRLLLRGSKNSYSLQATVNVADSNRMTVELPDGRLLSVPASAIVSLERRINGTSENYQPARLPRRMSDVLEPLDALFETSQHSALEQTHDTMVSISNEVSSAQRAIEGVLPEITHPSNGAVLAQVEELLRLLMKRLQAKGFREAEEFRAAYLEASVLAASMCGAHDCSGVTHTKVSALLRRLATAEEEEWAKYTQRFDPRPRILTGDRPTINVDASGEFLLPIRVILDEAYLPARGVTVVLDQYRGLDQVGHSPVHPVLDSGAIVTLQVRMVDRRRQGAKDDVRIEAHVTYAGLDNEIKSTPRQKIIIRLRRPAAHQPIENPFRDYASGVPVDNPGMFFGRTETVQDIVEHLTLRNPGRCYALYGQKRTGKSSVLEQVKLKLEAQGVLVADVSMGSIDRSSITASFMTEVLDQLRGQVGDRLSERVFEGLLSRWPDSRTLASQPLRSFRTASSAARALLKKEGFDEPRIVIVVDEFTYLYEILRRSHVSPSEHDQLRDFMRQWKSLLEAKLFSALVIGQDTMPHFIAAFPNEFSVMHTERLDYLTVDETSRLADEPIRNADGSSRFAGYALAHIPMYTAGHPYFTQIVCDRIVALANELKRSEIAEYDVQGAIETLLEGSREIGSHRFDCLLSADNTGVLLGDSAAREPGAATAKEIAVRVLHRLARLAGGQNSPVDIERLQMDSNERQTYRDLVVRQVVSEREGCAQIRVLLFAEYLRRMSNG